MSLPPIGRRAFVADAAGGLLLCTLAGKKFSIDEEVPVEALNEGLEVPPKVAAARANGGVAPGAATVLAKAVDGERVLDPGRAGEVGHRPQGPRPDDGQEGQGQDDLQGLRLPPLLGQLRRAARPGEGSRPADRGQRRRDRHRPLPQQALDAGDDAPARHPVLGRHGRRLQGQVHRSRRVRPEGRRVHLHLGGRRRDRRAPGSTTTTGRWTRCRSTRACSGRSSSATRRSRGPTREFFLGFHSFQPAATGLDQPFYCINGRAYAGNTPTLEAKVGERGRLPRLRASTTTSTPSTSTATAGPDAERPIVDNETLGPGDVTTARFTEDNPGRWFYHCHVFSHLHPGDERLVPRRMKRGRRSGLALRWRCSSSRLPPTPPTGGSRSATTSGRTPTSTSTSAST